MIFPQNYTSSFPKQKEISFNLNLSIEEINFSFGFSGENKKIEFKSIDGNIFDPKDSFVYAVSSGKLFSISGDINENLYSYYIENIPFSLNENKEAFEIENFYFKNTLPLSGDLRIYGGIPSYQLSFAESFISGANITGLIKNTSYNESFSIYDIYGQVYGFLSEKASERTSLLFLDKPTGEIAPQETLPFSISTSGIDFKSLKNVFSISFNTNFKNFNENFNADLITNISYVYSLDGSFTVNNNRSDANYITDVGVISYQSFDRRNDARYSYNKPLYLSLEYLSGLTGHVSGNIAGSGYNNINITKFITGSGFLQSFDSGIISGRNLITNQIITGVAYNNIVDPSVSYLTGNLDQNVTIKVSGYSTGEFINQTDFLGTGDPTIIIFKNDFLSGFGYLTGSLSNYTFSGENNNTIFYTKLPILNFITGDYITGPVSQNLNNSMGSGIIEGFANHLFTGKSYAYALGSGYIVGSGFLTGTNVSLVATGKASGSLEDIETIRNISQDIYGFKIATGIVATNLFLTGYGSCTGNYIGTNYYGNILIASGNNALNVSGFLNGEIGFLTGYTSGILYDKYGSSGRAHSSGLMFYNPNQEIVSVTNTDDGIVDGQYKPSGLYNYTLLSGPPFFTPIFSDKKALYTSPGTNNFIRWTDNSGWTFVKNNAPIYRSLDNVDSPAEAKNWSAFFFYQNFPILSGKKTDYIDSNFSIYGTGYDLAHNINLDYITIYSDPGLEQEISINNITGSGYYFFNGSSVSGTGKIPVYNNLDFNLLEYDATGIIGGINTQSSGIVYFTGINSGNIILPLSGAATVYTSFGFPSFISITGAYNSGYNINYVLEDSGIKILNQSSSFLTNSFSENYSDLSTPPNLYFNFWQTDSPSLFSNSHSPNGQYFYRNNLSSEGVPIDNSGYIGPYHYIVYDSISGWQIRRRSSNLYGWSGLKTIDFPTSGWTGFNLSEGRIPGQISKIGFSTVGLRSTTSGFENNIYFNLPDQFNNNLGPVAITGSGSVTIHINSGIIYTGSLKSGVALLPIVGTLTGKETYYITGSNRSVSVIKSGLMNNLIPLTEFASYTSDTIFGTGKLVTQINKTGYYESSGLVNTTGYILSQVEFPYSGTIDSFSGYLNSSNTKNFSILTFSINNTSGLINTGISLRQDRSTIQDQSGRVKNLLPLNLYPITDYSGYQEYDIYATGLFQEIISGIIEVASPQMVHGKFLSTGQLSGSINVDYNENDSGIRYVRQNVTGLLINPYLIATDILLSGTGIGTGTYDSITYATGSKTRTISFLPTANIVPGITITGSGLIEIDINRNPSIPVYSGIAIYNNPYIENINGALFTGYINPFVATGSATKTLEVLLTGQINSEYVKSFNNSFSILTGTSESTMTEDGFSLLNNKYYINTHFSTGLDSFLIRINKSIHLSPDPIYARLTISGSDFQGNPSVIYRDITGGLF
jgi:hypothetical protein